jgi:hypothetical protein
MRIAIVAVCLVASVSAFAQTSTDSKPGDSPHSTGRSVVPADPGVNQPQGQTGPLNTTTGGAPAESPQGQTPPGMQSAPEGSSKTTVEPSK